MQIVYFSLTGQTRRFIRKTQFSALEITKSETPIEMEEPFVLIVPSYDSDMVTPVFNFLEYKSNLAFLKGVVGSGNRNFGDGFVMTAKYIAQHYKTRLLFAFEFNGTTDDVENFKKVVSELDA